MQSVIRRTMTSTAIDPAVDVKRGVRLVLEQVEQAFASRPATLRTAKPILVAVGKTKPAEMIADVYSCGQRHFGENYVQELVEKGSSSVIRQRCPEIRWHLIGHLQSNKVNQVLKTPGLYMIETIDTHKLADTVNKAWARIRQPDQPAALRVLLQINTSGEAAKSGCEPDDVVQLYRYIRDECQHLQLDGLMTIGKYGHDYSLGPNEDFGRMMAVHAKVCAELGLREDEVQVSLGMSNDYERAIAVGSSMVRVGTSIFGYRPRKEETAVAEAEAGN